MLTTLGRFKIRNFLFFNYFGFFGRVFFVRKLLSGFFIYTNFNRGLYGFIFTIFLGSFFLFMQFLEYYEAVFTFKDNVLFSSFFSLTGLHGLHVTIGLIFIIICFLRFLRYHFTDAQHLGFLFAI